MVCCAVLCAGLSIESTVLNEIVVLLQTIQLFEMIIVRHGLMVVGLPFSGKSCSLNMLAGALTDLKAGKRSKH